VFVLNDSGVENNKRTTNPKEKKEGSSIIITKEN
jgi:hypothetical protein